MFIVVKQAKPYNKVFQPKQAKMKQRSALEKRATLTRRYALYTLGLALLLSASSCVIPSEPVENTLQLSLYPNTDTLSPFATITIALSAPIADSPLVTFTLTPPFEAYTTKLAVSGDTLYLNLAEPLAGSTHYTIKPGRQFTDTKGSARESSVNSLDFFTYPFEQEPNNTSATADILQRKTFGRIATLNDTDCFAIPAGATALYLHSYLSTTTALLGTSPLLLQPERPFAAFDTLAIPDTTNSPRYAYVTTYHQSVGGYYAIGFIGKK